MITFLGDNMSSPFFLIDVIDDITDEFNDEKFILDKMLVQFLFAPR